jgi:hypothetical protein
LQLFTSKLHFTDKDTGKTFKDSLSVVLSDGRKTSVKKIKFRDDMEKDILKLVNSAETPRALIQAAARFEKQISYGQAQCIISAREQLRGKQFESMEQLFQVVSNRVDILDPGGLLFPVHGQKDKPTIEIPMLLLPLQIETRFVGTELLIRISPDEIFVDNHDEQLTAKEIELGDKFHANSDEQERLNAWLEIAQRYGSFRAAWIVKATDPQSDKTPIQHDDDWDKPARFIGLPDKFVVFVYLISDGKEILLEQVKGEPIDRNITLIRDPLDQDLSDDEIGLFDKQSKWITNFDEAVKKGMAVRVTIPKKYYDKELHFPKIIVIGIRNDSAESSQKSLEQLFDSHHYSHGFSFIPQDTPTNNTQDIQSPYTEASDDYIGGYEREVKGHPDWDSEPESPKTNAEKLGVALGLGTRPGVFKHAANSEDDKEHYAEALNTALWPATGDYFLRFLIHDNRGVLQGRITDGGIPLPGVNILVKNTSFGSVTNYEGYYSLIIPIGNNTINLSIPGYGIRSIQIQISTGVNLLNFDFRDATQDSMVPLCYRKKLISHFKNYVRGNGLLPTISAGKQPYGILPVSRLGNENWFPSAFDSDGDRLQAEFDADMCAILWKLAEKWKEKKSEIPHIGDQNSSDDGELPLMKILTMTPWSKELWYSRFIEEGFAGFVAAYSGLTNSNENDLGTLLNPWHDTLILQQQQLAEIIESLSNYKNTPLSKLLSWQESDLLSSNKPLVKDDKKPDDNPHYYIEALKDGKDVTSGTLLFELLDRSVILAKKFPDAVYPEEMIQEALAELLTLFRHPEKLEHPLTPEQMEFVTKLARVLERLFMQFLDTCSHRLDAWISSLANNRLAAMRKHKPHGIYLGAYGYVENLRGKVFSGSTSSYSAAVCTILEFFNNVKDHKEIMVKIIDDPDFGPSPPRAYAIGKRKAERILEVRNRLSNERFDSIRQIEEIEGIGPDTFHDILYTFRYQDRDVQAILTFFNTAESIAEIKERISDDPEFGAISKRAFGINKKQAAGILAKRAKLPGKKFTSLQQIEEIRGIGLDTFHDILYSFSDDEQKRMSKTVTEGYIHAPSVQQAYMAAILRNGFLSHRERLKSNGNKNLTEAENPFVINLPSRRLRKAKQLWEGVRNGQSLSELLGYQFERSLYDAGLALNLNRFIDDCRKLFPAPETKALIKKVLLEKNENEDDNGNELNEKEIADKVAARSVVDGLAMARGWQLKDASDTNLTKEEKELKKSAIGLSDLTDNMNKDEENAFLEALNELAYTMDALGDLSVSEATYQAVGGNYDRAAAVLKASSTAGTPPELESMKTQVNSTSFEHRLCFVLQDSQLYNDKKHNARAKAEPLLENWVADLLGSFDKIGCTYSIYNPNTWEENKLTLADLNIAALDVLYLSKAKPDGKASDMERLITHFIKRKHDLNHESEIRIDLENRGDFDYSISDVMELSSTVIRALGGRQYLNPAHFHRAVDEEAFTFKEEDMEIFRDRVSEEMLTSLKELKKDIENKGADNYDLPAMLIKASCYGIDVAIPNSDEDPELLSKKELTLNTVDKKIKECESLLARTDENGIHPNEKIELLVEACRALFGEDFIVLPTFSKTHQVQYDDTIVVKDHLSFLQVDASRTRLWLQQNAQVHGGAEALEDCNIYTDAWKEALTQNGTKVFPLCISQTSEQKLKHWIALADNEIQFEELYENWNEKTEEEKDDLRRPRNVISLGIVGSSKDELTSQETERLAGLMLDQWDESIPAPAIDSGLAFQYNAPNTQAPQCLLLAVPGKYDRRPNKWTEDELAAIVADTIQLAKIRAIDTDAMPNLGGILPALFLPANKEKPELV